MCQTSVILALNKTLFLHSGSLWVFLFTKGKFKSLVVFFRTLFFPTISSFTGTENHYHQVGSENIQVFGTESNFTLPFFLHNYVHNRKYRTFSPEVAEDILSPVILISQSCMVCRWLSNDCSHGLLHAHEPGCSAETWGHPAGLIQTWSPVMWQRQAESRWTMTMKRSVLLPSLQRAGFSFLHLVDGWGGGEKGIVWRIEGGAATVSLVNQEWAGTILQCLKDMRQLITVLSTVIRGRSQGKKVPYSGDAEGLTINYKVYVCEIAR